MTAFDHQTLTKDDSQIELSIVMPCLNEIETLGSCIEKARSALCKYDIAGEIIVADNGSDDGSPALAMSLGARVVSVDVKGYGSALMGGIMAARGKYIIMGDSDGSYDFSDIALFIENLRSGYDLVMGNRFLGGIKPGAMPRLHRYLGTPVLSWIGKLFFHSPCRDFNCGLRGFTKSAIERMDLRTMGMEFASEIIVKATLLGMQITEVPTVLSPDGRSRPPHLQSWRDGWRHLRFLLLYCPRWLFLFPGLLLILVGLVLGIYLLPEPRRIGSVTLDVHTLLYCALAVILGFQAVTFALFTKIFATSEGLLPEDPQLERGLRYFRLEFGLIVGMILVMIGIGGSIYSVAAWGMRSFGPLNPSLALRIVIPSVTSLTLGCQIVLASFFLSVLGLRRR